MNKKEFIKLLEDLGIPFNEAQFSDKNKNQFPRIVYWEFVWDDIAASNTSYKTTVTYQISFISNEPRDKALLRLRKDLHGKGIRPVIQHEFLEKEKEFHSFLAVDVLENLDDLE